MLKILYGSESYLIDYYKKKFHAGLADEMDFKEFNAFNEETLGFLKTWPVFSEKRHVTVNIKTLRELDNGAFASYLRDTDAGICVVICKDIGNKNKFRERLEKSGYLQICDKYSDISKVRATLLKEVERLGGNITPDAVAELISLSGYLEVDAVTLYDLIDSLRKCHLASGGRITLDVVKQHVSSNESAKLYKLANFIVSGDIQKLAVQAELLSGNVMGVLGMLLWEYRIAYKALYYPLSDIGAFSIRLKGLGKERLISGISIIMESINGIKSGSLPESSVLLYTFERLIL